MNGGMVADPEDDAFIRTAIRGMRPPEHHESFWDRLAGELDAAEDTAGVNTVFGAPGSLDDLPAPKPAPKLAPKVAPKPRPKPAPTRPAAHAKPAGPVDHPPRTAPLRATGQAFVDAPRVPRVDPLAGFKVRHDAATMPAAMRRTSNVVLLTLALAAILIAVIAGLSLVKSRSDSGAPPLRGDLTGVTVQTR